MFFYVYVYPMERENEELPLPYFFDVLHYEEIGNENLTGHIDRVGKIVYSVKQTEMKSLLLQKAPPKVYFSQNDVCVSLCVSVTNNKMMDINQLI